MVPALLAWLLLAAAHPPVSFIPAGPLLSAPTDEYRAIWEAEGERIVAAMEKLTGIPFPDEPIEVIVSEGSPMTAFDGRSMRLRAAYTPTYKKSTLVHEMGHRLSFMLPRTPELDDHRLLYLFLYDAWTDLYGQAFADRMARIERRIGPAYAEAWDWALAMTREERQGRLAALRALRLSRASTELQP